MRRRDVVAGPAATSLFAGIRGPGHWRRTGAWRFRIFSSRQPRPPGRSPGGPPTKSSTVGRKGGSSKRSPRSLPCFDAPSSAACAQTFKEAQPRGRSVSPILIASLRVYPCLVNKASGSSVDRFSKIASAAARRFFCMPRRRYLASGSRGAPCRAPTKFVALRLSSEGFISLSFVVVDFHIRVGLF
jgi:hypothetical protein